MNSEKSNIPYMDLSHLSLQPRNDFNVENCYPTLKICLIIQGRGQWRIGSKGYPIETGDVFLLNNIETRALHTITPPDPLHMMILAFEPRFIWLNGFNVFDTELLSVYFNRNPQFKNRVPCQTAMSHTVKKEFFEIQKEYAEKLPKYEEIIKVKTLNLITLLNRYYINEVNIDLVSTGSKPENLALINQVMEYIDDHVSEKLTLEKLSGIAHMNPSYFSTLFKKYNGLSISEYILKKRILLSIGLLSNKEDSVLCIAQMCGFRSSANFYKYFKKLTGKTPSEFRNMQSHI